MTTPSLPWIQGLPTPEQVTAHAARFPLRGGRNAYGLWLQHRRDRTRDVDVTFLPMHSDGGQIFDGDGYRLLPHRRADARYLPCTPEGIPVCLLPAALETP